MYCSGCGSALVGGARFCVSCGAAVAPPSAPVMTHVLPMPTDLVPDVVSAGPAYGGGANAGRNAGIAVIALAVVIGAVAGGVAYGRHSGHSKGPSLAQTFARQQQRGFDAQAKSDLKGMQVAEETFLTDNPTSYTSDLADLTIDGFLASPGTADSIVGVNGSYGYCLSSVSQSGTTWYLGSSTGGPTTTPCVDS